MPVRVLIVDDSAMMRSFLREVLSDHQDIEVVGTAPDANTARQKIKLLDPDVVTLDIEMPGMDGVTFLEHLMRLRPMPVVMVSSLTQRGAQATLRSLELGAADFVAKPTQHLEAAWPEFRAEVSRKVIAAAKSKAPAYYPAAADPLPLEGNNYSKIVAIGGSTGSVSVIQHIICSMPADGPPIVVAVHMPPLFTKQFASRLNGLSRMSVTEASPDAPLNSGCAYIAPGDSHLTIHKLGMGFACKLEAGPRVNGHVPSVDVLFESVAMQAAEGAVGILLSGMGKDGAVGLKTMSDAGAQTATQDEASCVIYGMPAAAVALGASTRELDALAIPQFIIDKALGTASPVRRFAQS
jgi:two-component system, chemotaxis family, protein-glutamate methylesterase/glutaminase